MMYVNTTTRRPLCKKRLNKVSTFTTLCSFAAPMTQILRQRCNSCEYHNCFRSTLRQSLPSTASLKCPSVRRGRRVMHSGMQYDLIQSPSKLA